MCIYTHTYIYNIALCVYIYKIYVHSLSMHTHYGFPGGASDNAGDLEDMGLISGLGRFPGGGHDIPL